MTSMFAKSSAWLCHNSYFAIQDEFRGLRCLPSALHACVITQISLYRMNYITSMFAKRSACLCHYSYFVIQDELLDFDVCKAFCMPVSLLIFRNTRWIRWLRCLQSALHTCCITHISSYRMNFDEFDVCQALCMPESLLIFRYTEWI